MGGTGESAKERPVNGMILLREGHSEPFVMCHVKWVRGPLPLVGPSAIFAVRAIQLRRRQDWSFISTSDRRIMEKGDLALGAIIRLWFPYTRRTLKKAFFLGAFKNGLPTF